MKLILIAALLLTSCVKPESDPASAPANSPADAAPQRYVEATPSQETVRVATIAGLGDLTSLEFGEADVEMRVWFGFGLFPLEGFVISRRVGEWSAIHLQADRYYEPKKVSLEELQAPKSGWEACWQQFVDVGALTLPDGTDPPFPDGEGYEVQVRNGAAYRSYQYPAPEYSHLPAAKHMLEMGDIISDEFGLLRFKARKRAASENEAEHNVAAGMPRVRAIQIRSTMLARHAAER